MYCRKLDSFATFLSQTIGCGSNSSHFDVIGTQSYRIP